MAGWAAYNVEELRGRQDSVSWLAYLGEPDFWNRTSQNRQSEMLAVGSMAVLAVYLRQRGSPESEPVGASHSDTGDTGCVSRRCHAQYLHAGPRSVTVSSRTSGRLLLAPAAVHVVGDRALRTIGVEEEFLLVDGRDGRPRASASAVLGVAGEQSGGRVAEELQLEQVETETDPCESLDELAAQIRAARRRMAASAHAMGVEIAALGTSPLPVDASLTPSRRYERMAERFGLTIHE